MKQKEKVNSLSRFALQRSRFHFRLSKSLWCCPKSVCKNLSGFGTLSARKKEVYFLRSQRVQFYGDIVDFVFIIHYSNSSTTPNIFQPLKARRQASWFISHFPKSHMAPLIFWFPGQSWKEGVLFFVRRTCIEWKAPSVSLFPEG